MKKRNKLLIILFSSLSLLLISTTAISQYYSRKLLLQDFAQYQQQLRNQGVYLQIKDYRRGLLHSHAHWQLNIIGQPTYQGTLDIDHTPLLSAGLNWTRIHWQGKNNAQGALTGMGRLNLTAHLFGEQQFSTLQTPLFTTPELSLSFTGNLFNRQHLDWQIYFAQGKANNSPVPTWQLNVHSNWTQDNTNNIKTGNPWLDWLCHYHSKHHFKLNNDGAELTGILVENINNPIQLFFFNEPNAPFILFDGSQFQLDLTQDTPYLSQIKSTLPVTFNKTGEKIHASWQFNDGKILSF